MPQIFALISQIAFYLLALEQLDFKLADLLLKQGDPLAEEVLSPEAVLRLLAELE